MKYEFNYLMNGNMPKFNSSNLGTSVCVYLERVNN